MSKHRTRHHKLSRPELIVGGGQSESGRRWPDIPLPEKTPIANLHLTLLQKRPGIESDKWSDSTRPIPGV